MLTHTSTWTDCIQAWVLLRRAIGTSEGTISTRTSWMRNFAKAFPGGPLSVTHHGIVAWMAGNRWKPETRRAALTSVRVLYDFLVGEGLVETSPTARIPKVKIPFRPPRPTPEDIFETALADADERVLLAMMLMGFCAMRVGEVAAASTGHVERYKKGWALRVVGKGGRERLVPLPADVATIIRGRPKGWLFPSTRPYETGQHLSGAWLAKLIKRQLGDADLTSHTLRHRAATVSLERTKDLRAVQELLGHASLVTTQQYTFVSADRLVAAVEATALEDEPRSCCCSCHESRPRSIEEAA